MTFTEFHPELRSRARLIPRSPIRPLTLPFFRLWDRHSNNWGWRAYLAGTDRDVAVPARRADLAGLPPTWIGVGSLDLFHDEDRTFFDSQRAMLAPLLAGPR